MLLNHIAIIVSSEEGVEFYKAFGFNEVSRRDRQEQHDSVIVLQGLNSTLEIFVDGTHPARVTNPEALGLRHLCFQTEDLSRFTFKEPIRVNADGERYSFLKDPDGLPIEIKEVKPHSSYSENITKVEETCF